MTDPAQNCSTREDDSSSDQVTLIQHLSPTEIDLNSEISGSISQDSTQIITEDEKKQVKEFLVHLVNHTHTDTEQMRKAVKLKNQLTEESKHLTNNEFEQKLISDKDLRDYFVKQWIQIKRSSRRNHQNEDADEENKIVDRDLTLDNEIVISDLPNNSDPKFLKTGTYRLYAMKMYIALQQKYQFIMENFRRSYFEDGYVTDMTRLLYFTCYDALNVIRTLESHFKYDGIDFTNLPIFFTVKQNRGADFIKCKNYTLEIHGLWYDKGLSEELYKY